MIHFILSFPHCIFPKKNLYRVFQSPFAVKRDDELRPEPSRIVMILLSAIGGGCGLHKFYQGHTASGLIRCFLSSLLLPGIVAIIRGGVLSFDNVLLALGVFLVVAGMIPLFCGYGEAIYWFFQTDRKFAESIEKHSNRKDNSNE